MPSDQSLGILDISAAEHHALRALSSSGMKDLAVSPLRYWYHQINPAPKPDEEETKAQRMGSALHCAVLESPEVFDSRYARELDPGDWPECLDTMEDLRRWFKDKTGAPAKGTRKDEVIAQCLAVQGCPPILEVERRRHFAQHEGKTILNVDEWERLAGMARALIEEPALKPILRDGKPEVTLVTKDPETGVLLKARVDWLSPRWILDLKTFTVKRGNSIDKSIADAIYFERYYIQAYLYCYVVELVTGEKRDFVEAFVESDQPHETRIKSLLPKWGSEPNLYWMQARNEVRRLIRLYAECLDRWGEEPWRETQAVVPLQDEDVRQFSWT